MEAAPFFKTKGDKIMGKKSGYRPLRASTIRSILANNPSVKASAEENTEPVIAQAKMPATPANPPVLVTLSGHAEYDTTNPVEHISDFVAFAKLVITRYEENDRLIRVYDQETQDVLHYIELHENLNAAQGNEMYKKLREIRRKRRLNKNEMDLLEPVYNFFKTQSELTDQLPAVQGKCKQLKAGINGRQYTLRTGVIQD